MIGLLASIAMSCMFTAFGAVSEATAVLTLLAIAPPLAWALLPVASARVPRIAIVRPAVVAAVPSARAVPEIEVLAVAMAHTRAMEQRWGKVSA